MCCRADSWTAVLCAEAGVSRHCVAHGAGRRRDGCERGGGRRAEVAAQLLGHQLGARRGLDADRGSGRCDGVRGLRRRYPRRGRHGHGRKRAGLRVRALRAERLRALLRHERGWAEAVSEVCGEEGLGWGSWVDGGGGCHVLGCSRVCVVRRCDGLRVQFAGSCLVLALGTVMAF